MTSFHRAGGMPCYFPLRRYPEMSDMHGQAMIFFVVTVLAALLVTVGVYNVGQTVSEKTRLTNTADAAAYSGAVWEARELNFQAYTNRAMVANEVAIGQMVSIDSWIHYVKSVTTQLADFSWVPYIGQFLYELNSWAGNVEGYVDNYAPDVIYGENGIIQTFPGFSLSAAQTAAHVAAIAAVPGVVSEVVKINDPNASLSGVSNALLLKNVADFTVFTQQYSGADRSRFKDVTMHSRDGFTETRDWSQTMPGYVPVDQPSDMLFPPWTSTLDKRGGTDIIGLDEWRGVDTLSNHYTYWGTCGKLSIPCQKNYEASLGYGGATVYDTSVGITPVPGLHGNAPTDNPKSYQNAMGSTFGKFGGAGGFGSALFKLTNGTPSPPFQGGLPAYRDVSDLTPGQDLTLELPVEVTKNESNIQTSDNTGIDAGRLQLSDQYACNKISKLTQAEVYFMHPDTYAGYGGVFSRPIEYGSLFNPYWHARLVEPSVAAKAMAALDKLTGSCL